MRRFERVVAFTRPKVTGFLLPHQQFRAPSCSFSVRPIAGTLLARLGQARLANSSEPSKFAMMRLAFKIRSYAITDKPSRVIARSTFVRRSMSMCSGRKSCTAASLLPNSGGWLVAEQIQTHISLTES
jgi:hypothetical protein